MTGDKPEGVSVIMIGLNEARFLPLTLPPLQQVADEIIFVDTGSQDRTIELASKFGCQIFHQPWADNFSTPKNLAIEQARFSWILNVDCDEALMDAVQARETILAAGGAALEAESMAPGCIIRIDNLMKNGEIMSSQALRLFRNDPRIRFNNPVHEGVADSLFRHWPHAPPNTLDIVLRHYGYQTGINKAKLSRNMAILRKWVQQEPNHIYASFKLGANLRQRGHNREGLFFLEKAYALLSQAEDKGSYPFLNNLLTNYHQALIDHGMQEKALEMQQNILTWR